MIHFNHVNFISQQEKQFAGKIKEYPPNMTCITIGTCVILHIMYQIYIRRSRIARTKRLTPKDSSRRTLRESELKIKIFQLIVKWRRRVAIDINLKFICKFTWRLKK